MQTIFLEFAHKPASPNMIAIPAATGSDSIFYLDGRWKWETRIERIYDRVAELRELRPSMKEMLFTGYTVSGSHHNGGSHATVNLSDPNKPEWAAELHAQGRSATRGVGVYPR